MFTDRPPRKSRLNTIISDASCPGLNDFLDKIPAGDKDPLIRAVLLEWFERHAAQGNLEAAISEMAGRSKLAVALQRAGMPSLPFERHLQTVEVSPEKGVASILEAALPAASNDARVSSPVALTVPNIHPVQVDASAPVALTVVEKAPPGHVQPSSGAKPETDDDHFNPEDF